MPPGIPNIAPLGVIVDPVVDAFKALGKALADVGKVVRDVLNPLLGPLANGLKQVGVAIAAAVSSWASAIGGVIAQVFNTKVGRYFIDAAQSVAAAMGSIGRALGAVAAAAGIAVGAVLAIGVVFGSFLQKANPAVFQQFQFALDDLMAVIGQALVPVFQTLIIPLVRTLADAFLELVPVLHTLMVAFRPLIELFVNLIGNVLVGAFRMLGNIVEYIAPYILALGRLLSEIFGLSGTGGRSVGAAARSASHMDPMEAVKAAQRGAYSLGKSAADPMLAATESIAAKAEKIYLELIAFKNAAIEFFNNPTGFKTTFGGHSAPVATASITGMVVKAEAARLASKVPFIGGSLASEIKKPGVFGYTSLVPWD